MLQPRLNDSDTDENGEVGALPSFLGIGAQRAATTWLHNCLKEHPEVFVPEEKELAYFIHNYDKGESWYKSCFGQSAGSVAIGEVTPTYYCNATAMARIAATIPKARLILILRNPVDRAFSAYQLYRVREGWGSFEEAIKRAKYLVSFGFYAQHLSATYKHFDREQVLVCLYEDVQQRPGEVLKNTYSHIGVDPSFESGAKKNRVNRIVYPKTQERLRSAGLGWAIDLLKKSPAAEWVKRRANTGEAPSPRIVQELKARYREDTLELQDLIGRDLSNWL